MKKILFVFASLCLLSGCEKPDHSKDLLNSVCEGMMGKYVCKSITYLGEPIDVNGDGVCSTDLVSEFKGLDNCITAIETFQRISPAPDYNVRQNINLEIPIQNVDYDQRWDVYRTSLTGNMMFITFSYTVANDGSVTFDVHPEEDSKYYKETYTGIDYLDNGFTHGDRIVSISNGILVAVINCAFYDYNTKTFIKGQAEYTYERVSYSL